tara:strand:- start:79 stop:681 length:603 start_codon:yes stop_codon:yes gene_type:complete
MHQQGTPAWFKQRKGRITGSRIGAILNMNSFSTPQEVLRDMVRDHHGLKADFQGNRATEHGNFFEPMATEDLKIRIGKDVKHTGFHEFEDWLGASPDGLVDDEWIVEIKCPYRLRNDKTVQNFKLLSQQQHYYAQVQYEMLCSGRTKAYFYQWTPSGAELLEEIPLNHGFIEETLPKLQEFYKLYLSELDNPRHLKSDHP